MTEQIKNASKVNIVIKDASDFADDTSAGMTGRHPTKEIKEGLKDTILKNIEKCLKIKGGAVSVNFTPMLPL